jgi:hypothetical protein
MKTFLQRHADHVMGAISGFDRLRFRGTLRPLAHTGGMCKFLYASQVLYKDFKEYVTTVTDQVRAAARQLAEKANRPLEYLASSNIDKEQWARQRATADGVEKGLIGVLSCVELCRSYHVQRNPQTKHLDLAGGPSKCLHYYFYFQHPRVGLLHARLQTWFPFDLRICFNGREWLCRELDRAGVGYLRRENCLVAVDDVPRAQRLLDRQLRTDWCHLLGSIADQVHPTRHEIVKAWPTDYYWSLDESEWATDILFRSPAELAALYPMLVRHAMSCFGSRDVLRFLGRKVPTKGAISYGRFNGEVLSDLRQRPEGMRVKHRLNKNSIKMYDKQGSVMRVETTINCPHDMKVYRPKEGDEGGPKSWRYMRKGVADVHRRAEVSQAANERYLDSLAAAQDTTPLGQLSEPLCKSKRYKGKPVRALNPLAADDAALLTAVSRGEFSINGFRNRDLQPLLYSSTAKSPDEKRRRSAAVTRKLRLLRAHGLIRKVPRTHRYQVSDKGRLAIAALLAARQADAAKLTAAA